MRCGVGIFALIGVTSAFSLLLAPRADALLLELSTTARFCLESFNFSFPHMSPGRCSIF